MRPMNALIMSKAALSLWAISHLLCCEQQAITSFIAMGFLERFIRAARQATPQRNSHRRCRTERNAARRRVELYCRAGRPRRNTRHCPRVVRQRLRVDGLLTTDHQHEVRRRGVDLRRAVVFEALSFSLWPLQWPSSVGIAVRLLSVRPVTAVPRTIRPTARRPSPQPGCRFPSAPCRILSYRATGRAHTGGMLPSITDFATISAKCI